MWHSPQHISSSTTLLTRRSRSTMHRQGEIIHLLGLCHAQQRTRIFGREGVGCLGTRARMCVTSKNKTDITF